MAKKPAPSRLSDNYQTYPTAGAAATAALRGITNTKNESGGGILYNKAQNIYAATESVGQGDGEHFAASVGVPQGWALHSTYHTHPIEGTRSTQFSGDDINTAKQLKAPSYILARADDKIRMFDPASSKVLKDPPAPGSALDGSSYSLGTPVDETPPPPPLSAAVPTPAPAPAPTDAAAVPVTGSLIMDEFAAKHRAKKYKPKIVHIK